MISHFCREYPCPVCTGQGTGTQPIITRRPVPDRIRYIARLAAAGKVTTAEIALHLYTLADILEDEGK